MKKVIATIMVFLIAFSMISMFNFVAKADPSAVDLWRVPTLDNTAINGKDSGDVDGDGIEDLAILTIGGTLQVIRNDGIEIWSRSIAIAGGSPGISDVDRDGKGEVFAFSRLGSTGIIYCFDNDGTELWQFTAGDSTGIFGYAAFLNLDADAELEIFVTATAGYGAASTSYALDTDGSVMWSFSTSELGNQMMHTDVTGDGVEEIILATFQKIYILDKSGALLRQYQPDLAYTNSYIAAGDLTGDGIDDIALSRITGFNTLYTLANDCSFLWKKEYGSVPEYYLSPPMSMDMDDDGSEEVAVYGGGMVRAFDSDGTELWTWGNSTVLPYFCWPGNWDVNRDGKDEIVTVKNSHVYALSLEGNLVMDFDLPNNGDFILAGTGGRVEGRETPRWGEVADVNDDGFDELIIQETIDGQYYVAALLVPRTIPTKWAVVIGIDDYSAWNPSKNLKGMCNSAEDMYDVLVNLMGFRSEHVHLLLDRVGVTVDNVTKKDVENELRWLQKVTIPEDTVVFYFAGHGMQSKTGGEEYLVMHDVPMVDYEFADNIRKIEFKNLCAILDASYCGGFITDGQSSWDGLLGIARKWSDVAEGKPNGTIVLTACAENVGPLDFRDAGQWRFGTRYEAIFTHYLVVGFKGKADSNGDGNVTVEEAFRYARRQPLVLVSQTPMMYDGYPEYASGGELFLGS